MKPILKYPGAKWRLSSWILSHMPRHESYLEPFFGSGAVFFQKEKSRIETINDMDGEVVNFFKVCRDHPDELAKALALTPWAREERTAAYEPTTNDTERARRFAVRCWMTFGAFPNRNQGWRHTTGKQKDGGPDNPKLWARMPQCVREVSVRLLQAQIENKPALEVIRRHNGPEVLIYADPPYMLETRTAKATAYSYEMTNIDHAELLEALKGHRGMVLLSGYDNPLYRESLQGWMAVQTRTTAERGAKRVETLWLNPKAEEALERR